MTLEVDQLSSTDFKALCLKLLNAVGYSTKDLESRVLDIGIDAVVVDQYGTEFAVEIKRIVRRITSRRFVRDAANQLRRGAQLIGAEGRILIISMRIPSHITDEIRGLGVEIYDGRWIEDRLAEHPQLEQQFAEVLATRSAADQLRDADLSVDARAVELRERLTSIPRGKSGWRDYEDICIEILNYLFIPPLKVPKVQSTSEDGLDQRDAIYPISGAHEFWVELKRDTKSRFLVAEFKNYTDPITQKEIESIQQYLFSKAKRLLGIICSRVPVSESALKARRRAWVEFDKLIIMVTDDDMIDMLTIRGMGNDPTVVLDSQLDEFFLELTP